MEIEETERVSKDQRLCENCYVDLAQDRKCKRCGNSYCAHFASKQDFQFCIYCFHDLVIEDSIIRKVIETRSLTGKKTFTRVMRARHIVFKGQDWMFAQARINTLSDQELDDTIEYHRVIMGEMLNEREVRKITANKKALAVMMRNSSLKIPSVRKGYNTDGTPIDTIGTDSTTVTTTTVKRTRITATQTNSTQVALQAIVSLFKAQGMTEEQIKVKLIAMAGNKP